MREQSSGGPADRISAEIAAVASLYLKDLKLRWRDLYDTEPPPRISRELLTRGIAYGLQEREFGGRARATRGLRELLADALSSHRASISHARKPAPGPCPLREWCATAEQAS